MDAGRRNLIVIFISNLVASTGMAGFLPAFPIILPKLGISDPAAVGIWTGILTAAAPLSAAISGPLWGALGDRVGRKIMVLRALGGIAVFVGLMALVSDPWILLILRISQGAFSGFIAPSLTLVSVHTSPARQGLVAALLQAALIAGGVVGPPIGGLVLDNAPAGFLFLSAAAAAALSMLLVQLFAREESRPAAPARRMSPFSAVALAWADIRLTLADRAIRNLFIALFAVRFGVSCVEPLFAFYVQSLGARHAFVANNLGFVNGALVAATPLGNLLALPAWGRAGDRRGHRRAFAIAAAGAGLLYAPQALAPEPVSLFMIRFLAGVFLAGAIPSAYGMVAEATPVSRRGSSYSLTFSAIALASSLAPPIGGGLLAIGVGVDWLFVLSAIPMLASAYAAKRWGQRALVR